jgi:hypothetical protein
MGIISGSSASISLKYNSRAEIVEWPVIFIKILLASN